MTESRNRLDFATHLDFSAILTNPILDIAARFWEEDRYEAFRVCYRSMRLIDDLVDNRKSLGDAISDAEVEHISTQMGEWLERVRAGSVDDEFGEQFIRVLTRFELPLWPWERLCRAMTYDLQHSGFASFPVFVRYTEGAAIAPAAIFMHLCGVRPCDNRYVKPQYDIRKVARPLALFSYLVHIMRDFEKDQRANLDYFADTLMARSGVTTNDLREIAANGRPTTSFRSLMTTYQRIAEYYRVKARGQIDAVMPSLDARYQLSLEMIYGLYMQIYERIEPVKGLFTTAALNPGPAEVKARIESIIEHFVPVPSAR